WFTKLRLTGLLPDAIYKETVLGTGIAGSDSKRINGEDAILYTSEHYGDELMNSGLITTDASAGEAPSDDHTTDYESRLYVLEAK
nr:GH36 C-terminal domain-containing protein [Lachnospiraceae bacterium]